MSTNKRITAVCPHIELRHEEFGCMSPSAIKLIPSREERANLSFTLFTILRDPIERIGAQAFYGQQTVGYKVLLQHVQSQCFDHNETLLKASGFQLLTGFLKSRCGGDRPLPYCSCVTDAMKAGHENLRVNESVWFEWFRDERGYGDKYMSNYYTKRLQATNVVECVKASDNRPCLGEDLLPGFKFSGRCEYDLPDMDNALLVAKDLLQTQYDFLLLEEMGTEGSVRLLSHALREPNMTIVSRLMHFPPSNPGLSSLSTQHRSIPRQPDRPHYLHTFPPAVLDFLLKDNHHDLELFRFAKGLYKERVAQYL